METYDGQFRMNPVKNEIILQTSEHRKDFRNLILNTAPMITASTSTAKDSPMITYQIF